MPMSITGRKSGNYKNRGDSSITKYDNNQEGLATIIDEITIYGNVNANYNYY